MNWMSQGIRTFAVLFFLVFSNSAYSDVIYQGWHKVLSAGQHVGYLVIRYDLDKKTNKFTYTSFLKTNAVGNDVTEALKAESLQVNQPVQWIFPLKYQYTSTQGKKVTLIDAVFEEQKLSNQTKKFDKLKKNQAEMASKEKPKFRMIATVTEDGKATKHDQILPDNTFLSSFLTYIILQSKDGLKVGNNYKYSGVAEEEGKVYEGNAFVKEMVKENGEDAFKIVNEFKGIRFISTVNKKGEPLSIKSPLLSIATEPAKSADEAAGKIKIDEKNIRTLFGDVPGAKL
jgi:hypothetical protein